MLYTRNSEENYATHQGGLQEDSAALPQDVCIEATACKCIEQLIGSSTNAFSVAT